MLGMVKILYEFLGDPYWPRDKTKALKKYRHFPRSHSVYLRYNIIQIGLVQQEDMSRLPRDTSLFIMILNRSRSDVIEFEYPAKTLEGFCHYIIDNAYCQACGKTHLIRSYLNGNLQVEKYLKYFLSLN